MKKLAKVFNKWFWGWFFISVCLVIVMLILGRENHPKIVNGFSGAIMALFMVMPVSNWLYRFIGWAIDFVSSINTEFKDKINPYATYVTLTDPTHRKENIGFNSLIHFFCGLTTLFLALLWMIFQSMATEVVFSILHTVEFIFTLRISWVAIFFELLITVGYCFAVFNFIKYILSGEFRNEDGSFNWAESWWKILLAIAVFYLKIIVSAMLLKYTSEMTIASLTFWTTTIGFPILFFEVMGYIRRKRRESN